MLEKRSFFTKKVYKTLGYLIKQLSDENRFLFFAELLNILNFFFYEIETHKNIKTIFSSVIAQNERDSPNLSLKMIKEPFLNQISPLIKILGQNSHLISILCSDFDTQGVILGQLHQFWAFIAMNYSGVANGGYFN